MKLFNKYILFAGLAAGSLAACNKQLEEYNPGSSTSDAVYSTPEGFESLVNAVYTYNRWWYGKENGYNISEMGTDIWTSGTGDVYPDLTQYNNLQASNGAVKNLWQQLYAAINLCNAGVTRIDGSGMTEDKKKIRGAELRFLRAFYYWHIVETWGNVHFTTTETNGVVTTANRTPVDTFYAQIFRDLDYAIANLPLTTSDYGRATKPVAEAFAARMYLTRGMNQQAADMAEKLISGYTYKLLPKYSDLWRMDNLVNTEVIWAVNYMKNLVFDDRLDATLYPNGHSRGANNAHMLFAMKYDDLPGMQRDIANMRPFNRYMPTLFMLNLFNEQADARYEASFKQVWYCNNTKTAPAGMKLGDTAIYISKYVLPDNPKYRIYDRNDIYKANGAGLDRTRYISLKKFDDATRASMNEEQSARDVFVIRLAEMYLIAAEAQLKLNNTTKAAEYLNVLRKRAAIAGHETEMEVKASDVTLDFILDERARELVGEQLRWFDLKRTGKLQERIAKYNPDANAYFQSYHLVRPIPQDQIDAVTNKDEFSQNPQYN
ncbi:RagB/SusD family nutrient uptake outer membrane protein [Chitinophaga sp. sic0106]|uniref:RagB/SusD family nutrient uptake outer membrane protein n=1 Tax=Chitinophaga sp. sic0106 TaxID=2854785 RepID=UPI001C4917CB|nr:RagB/SusD family nutrient uptake outer membrane protein [Chitinophaga sp. sic0106]MBV7530305.1 RagB/SusD family nutrient uptake outer membrane protein [Chitinophaga sp. sic0106]